MSGLLEGLFGKKIEDFFTGKKCTVSVPFRDFEWRPCGADIINEKGNKICVAHPKEHVFIDIKCKVCQGDVIKNLKTGEVFCIEDAKHKP